MSPSSYPHPLLDEESLTIAMAVAPTVYARNRMFALHKLPHVRRAKARAATIRGAVRQLASLHVTSDAIEIHRGTSGSAVVRYRVEALRLERRFELSHVELSCFLFLVARAGIPGMRSSAEDRATVERALEKLAVGLDLDASD